MKNKKNQHKIILNYIKTRCNNPNYIGYFNYGGRGIKCLITADEIKILMERDNYWQLKIPTIDRINNDGNYTFQNCRFVEKGVNSAERNKRVSSKAIVQWNKKGKFIKKWRSISEASRLLKISRTAINNCLLKLSKTSNNYIWRYKNEK